MRSLILLLLGALLAYSIMNGIWKKNSISHLVEKVENTTADTFSAVGDFSEKTKDNIKESFGKKK